MSDYEFTCTICGKKIKGEYGNNPFPYQKSGECCDWCNKYLVIPLRLRYFKRNRD